MQQSGPSIHPRANYFILRCLAPAEAFLTAIVVFDGVLGFADDV